MMLVPAAPTIFAMTFLPVLVLFAMMFTVFTITAVSFPVHWLLLIYKSIRCYL
jgi:predicted tellurium resistance membrane protein TerC